MATSTRYNDLQVRVNQIGQHLLPAVNPTGVYDLKELDLIRSYCLLCHAEFEAYLEDITVEIVDKAYNKWDKNKEIISPIIFHLAYNFREEAGKKRELPYSMVALSYKNLKEQIKKNNGIKEGNLNSFFRPIGFAIDPILQSDLNEYGKTRGQIAHTSFHTQQPLDVATEQSRVRQIMLGLDQFDQEFNTYESSGITNRSPAKMPWAKFSFLDRVKILFTGKY